MAYNKPTPDHQSDQNSGKFQVYINDISWNPKPIASSYQRGRGGDQRSKNSSSQSGEEELLKQMLFDIPDGVVAQASKNPNAFNDIIETFVCNALTRKFMHEVYHCQIWILD